MRVGAKVDKKDVVSVLPTYTMASQVAGDGHRDGTREEGQDCCSMGQHVHSSDSLDVSRFFFPPKSIALLSASNASSRMILYMFEKVLFCFSLPHTGVPIKIVGPQTDLPNKWTCTLLHSLKKYLAFRKVSRDPIWFALCIFSVELPLKITR